MNENIDLTKILKNCPKGKFDPNTLNPFDRVLTRHLRTKDGILIFTPIKNRIGHGLIYVLMERINPASPTTMTQNTF